MGGLPLIERRARSRRDQGARPLTLRCLLFERGGYRRRWKVERTIAWFGNFRRLVVPYDRWDAILRSFFILLASRSLYEGS